MIILCSVVALIRNISENGEVRVIVLASIDGIGKLLTLLYSFVFFINIDSLQRQFPIKCRRKSCMSYRENGGQSLCNCFCPISLYVTKNTNWSRAMAFKSIDH